MPIVPTITWIEQNPSIDPSGSRHLNSSPAGFRKVLSTGAGAELDFGSLNITASTQISETKCVYARLDSLGSASGVFGLKFYLTDITDWTTGTYRFLERKNIHFESSPTITGSDNDTPTVVPSTPNLYGTLQPGWTNGAPWMSGLLRDQSASQYIYLAVQANPDVPVGTYGVGGYRYRLLFNFA